MKKILFLLIFLLVVTRVFSQAQEQAYSKDYYLEKSRNQKNTALVLIGGGTLLAIIGAASFDAGWHVARDGDSTSLSPASETDFFGFMFMGGVAAGLASIPFFISAGHNARMAATISLNNQKMLMPALSASSVKTLPTLTVTIVF